MRYLLDTNTCIALAHNLTLVTHNAGEFGRITGLRFEDWE